MKLAVIERCSHLRFDVNCGFDLIPVAIYDTVLKGGLWL